MEGCLSSAGKKSASPREVDQEAEEAPGAEVEVVDAGAVVHDV